MKEASSSSGVGYDSGGRVEPDEDMARAASAGGMVVDRDALEVDDSRRAVEARNIERGVPEMGRRRVGGRKEEG